jgi:hypothetical protein
LLRNCPPLFTADEKELKLTFGILTSILDGTEFLTTPFDHLARQKCCSVRRLANQTKAPTSGSLGRNVNG